MAKNRNNLKFSSLKRNQLHSKANTHNSICRKTCHEDKKVGNKEYEKSRCKKSTYLIFTNVHTVRVLVQYRYNVGGTCVGLVCTCTLYNAQFMCVYSTLYVQNIGLGHIHYTVPV